MVGWHKSSTLWMTSGEFSVDMMQTGQISHVTQRVSCAPGAVGGPWNARCWCAAEQVFSLLGLKTSSSASGAVDGEVFLWTLVQNLADTMRIDRASCAPWATVRCCRRRGRRTRRATYVMSRWIGV